jgi:hypothetical protein
MSFELLDDRIKNWFRDFVVKNPKYLKFVKNPWFVVQLYAKHHPKEQIVPDFELGYTKCNIGGQIVNVDRDNKIIDFTLTDGYGDYQGHKFGWTGFYIGINNLMLNLGITKTFTIRATSIKENEVCTIPPSQLKIVHEKRWIQKSVKTTYYGTLKIYAVPIKLTDLVEQPNQTEMKLTDFVN